MFRSCIFGGEQRLSLLLKVNIDQKIGIQCFEVGGKKNHLVSSLHSYEFSTFFFLLSLD